MLGFYPALFIHSIIQGRIYGNPLSGLELKREGIYPPPRRE